MSNWFFPSEVVTSDDKVNYFKEQYDGITGDNYALYLSNNTEDIKRIITFRGYDLDDEHKTIYDLLRTYGVKGLLNNTNAVFGENKQLAWFKVWKDFRSAFRLTMFNCPSENSFYGDYDGYLIRPFFCKIPVNILYSNDSGISEIAEKNPYAIVLHYGMYNNNPHSSDTYFYVSPLSENQRIKVPLTINPDGSPNIGSTFRWNTLNVDYDGDYEIPNFNSEVTALRSIFGNASSVFQNINAHNASNNIYYYKDLNQGVFYNGSYYNDGSHTVSYANGVSNYAFSDPSRFPDTCTVATATVIHQFIIYEESLIDGNIPIFNFYEGNTPEELEQYLKDGTLPAVSTGLDTNFTIGIDGNSYPSYRMKWEHVGSSEQINNAKINFYSLPSGFRVMGDSIKERIEYIKSRGKLVREIDYLDGKWLFSYNGLLRDGHREVPIIEDVSTPIVGLRLILFVTLYNEEADSYYSTIGKEFLLFKEGSNLAAMYTIVGSMDVGFDNEELSFIEWDGSDDDDQHDDDDPEADDSGDEDDSSPELETNNLLTTTYKVTANHLQSLGAKIWNESFLSTLFKINSNPIENIISCKALPAEPPTKSGGADKNIILGNVDMEITGDICKEVAKIDVGTYKFLGRKGGTYYDFLDYEPFTSISIYLPFIGIQKLDTNIVMGRTIKVEYIIDVVSGSCKVFIRKVSSSESNPILYVFNATCGVDIPMSSMNRAQTEMGFLSSLVGVAGGAGVAAIGAARNNPYAVVNGLTNSFQSGLNMASSQYHTTTNGSASPNTDFHSDRYVYVIYDRPKLYDDLLTNTFYHSNGYVSHKTRQLSALKGYTEISPSTDLKNIICTTEEMNELKELLTTGFFINKWS